MNPLKIIWNITSKCGYDCKICATYSDRSELDLVKKNKVFNSILSIGNQSIKEIDFAGGDPLYVADSIQIIHEAIDILGKEKISVTTTGKGINTAIKMGENLERLLYNCEITIDSQDYLRNDICYVDTNNEAIKGVGKKITNLTINVPILSSAVKNDDIRKLVNMIAGIDVNSISVNLIRLMNVGRMGSQFYPDLYSPKHFVETFIKYAENTPIRKVDVHCALRGKILGKQCNMLEDKIGVDCSGNVFACAWGGYVGDYDEYNIFQNPFYIGNLLEQSLAEILKDKRAIELLESIKKHPTKHCRVFCFENRENNSIFEDIDPLFICGN